MSDEKIVLGPGPFSSPDPATDGYRQLTPTVKIDDGPSAAEAPKGTDAVGEAEEEENENPYEDATVDELHEIAETRGVEVEGSGAGGNKLKADYVKALTEADEAEDAAENDGNSDDS